MKRPRRLLRPSPELVAAARADTAAPDPAMQLMKELCDRKERVQVFSAIPLEPGAPYACVLSMGFETTMVHIASKGEMFIRVETISRPVSVPVPDTKEVIEQ